MNKKYDEMYMEIAEIAAKQSYATRLKVGCAVVQNEKIIALSYNGTPVGADNCCEDKVYVSKDAGGWMSVEEIKSHYPFEDSNGRYKTVTKQEVIHAEMNAILQVAKSTESIEGATIFVTHAPCLSCATHLVQAEVGKVYWRNAYRSTDGVEYLKKNGVSVEQLV